MINKQKLFNSIIIISLFITVNLASVDIKEICLEHTDDYNERSLNTSIGGLLWISTMPNDITNVAISSNGTYIAVGCANYRVYCFNQSSSTYLWSYNIGSFIREVAISSDGNYIAVAADSVYFLNTTNSINPFIWSYSATIYFHSVDISSNGSYVVAGRNNNQVYLFNSTDKANPFLWSREIGGPVREVSISSNGYYFVARTDSIYTFNITSSNPMWNYQELSSGYNINYAEITSNGQYIITTLIHPINEYSKINIFDTDNNTNPLLWSYFRDNDDIGAVAISSLGKNFTATISGSICFYEKSDVDNAWIKTKEYSCSASLSNIDMSSNGKYFATGMMGGSDHIVYIFQQSLINPIGSFSIGGQLSGYWGLLKISSNGMFIVAGSNDWGDFPFKRELFLYGLEISSSESGASSNGNGGGGGGNGKDNKETISLGNYYLIFIILGIVPIILCNKRKINFKKY